MKNTKKKLAAIIVLMAIVITSCPAAVHAKNVMDNKGAFWGATGQNYSELKLRMKSNNEKIKKLKAKYVTALKKEKAAKKKGMKVYGSLQLTGDGKTYMIIPHDKVLDIDEDYGYIVSGNKANSSNYYTYAGDGYYTWRLYKGKNTHKYGTDTYKSTLIRTNYGSAKYKKQIKTLREQNDDIKDAMKPHEADMIVQTTSESSSLQAGDAVGMEIMSSNKYISLGVMYDDKYFEVDDESISGKMCILTVKKDAPANTTTRVYYGNYGSNASFYIDITIEPEDIGDYDNEWDDVY